MLDKKYKIILEDKGQDLLAFITNENGQIEREEPLNRGLYTGGYIPIKGIQELNKPCMIHHPPRINYGFLKYKVEKIEEINNKKQN